jgi:hypothetical protein
MRCDHLPLPHPHCTKVIVSAVVLNKIGSGTHRVTQNSVGVRAVLVIWMPGKKIPERRSVLRNSETELPVLARSVTKTPLVITTVLLTQPYTFTTETCLPVVNDFCVIHIVCRVMGIRGQNK